MARYRVFLPIWSSTNEPSPASSPIQVKTPCLLKEADKVIVIDGCFLKYIVRILNNLVDEEKVVRIDAFPLYKKYADIFYMEDVPESERIDAARQVADQILPSLSDI